MVHVYRSMILFHHLDENCHEISRWVLVNERPSYPDMPEINSWQGAQEKNAFNPAPHYATHAHHVIVSHVACRGVGLDVVS